MRKKSYPVGGEFSAPELEAACGLPARSIEFLKREGLMPPPTFEGSKGKAALYDFTGFQRLTLTAVFLRDLGSLTIAARMAEALVRGADQIYGLVPFGLSDEWRPVYDGLRLPERQPDGKDDIYLMYEAVRAAGGFSKRGEVLRNDFRIAVIERRYVFEVTLISTLDAMPFEGAYYSPLLEIQSISRGQKELSEIMTFDDLMALGDEAKKRGEAEYFSARSSAVSANHINLSLAIRNALDRIYGARLAHQSKEGR